MNEQDSPKAADRETAWREHRLSQLRYLYALSLRAKMEAVEGMADVVRKFKAMREQGKFSDANDR
jgi:hypothetical protein